MSKTKSFTLGGKPLPVDLHTVWTDDAGQAPTLGDGAITFDFGVRDIRFVAQLEQMAGDAHVKLVGDLGPMPFSAESPAARMGLARIVEAANEHLGECLFRVTQGRLLLGHDLAIPMPVDATGLVTEITRFLVPTLPYVELVAIYIRPPLAPSRPGESALRPEWRKRKLGV
ncbi:hypothetical protein CU669_19770 [Paramagnetospirillum kuznetsovii]|uniref:Uncharacterized protein n=1 Tax=Paramagnetospirillum kuznetsovii TaxID=2053833 RepID=A0A364NSW2_9PROT|nr:hypothetical protein [Paramagnetospirillum kuznetsovii]RAU20173.1 hypothetical protein CU669_19770 [Paramagnetospirillum kuznetsovii]